MKTKALAVFLIVTWLTGGIAFAQDPPNYVAPDEPFSLAWTPADPPGAAYYVERWTQSTGEFAPMISVIGTQVTDQLVAGETAQYRVFSYTDTTWTDSTGTYTERCVGPTSDASIAVVAGTAPPPSTTPGGCGRPTLVQP